MHNNVTLAVRMTSEMSMINDEVSKAVLLLKQTLPEMNRRNIATTPENYAVWYEYVSKENIELIAAIDELERTRTPLTNEIHHDLYIKYVASRREAAINKLSETVRDVIHEYLRNLNAEGKGLSEYAQTLSSFSDRISQSKTLDGIGDMLAELLTQTRRREDATVQMQMTLNTMVDEMRELREQVARLNAESATDALTRVGNRQSFDVELEKRVHSAARNQGCLALLMLDLDHFRQFNDKFGHIIGDKVLRFFATLLKNNIKGNDFVARFGGEEFAVLLPDTDYEGAISVAENIRSRLAKQTLSDSAEKIQLGTITVSIGVACLRPEDNHDILLRRADRCMSEAKANGRNLVVGEKDMRQHPSDDSHTLV
jgi:diguanylate cyclase